MAKNTSFIRWAGGKAWFVPAVQDMIQNLQFNNYIEPFMGGASIFFSLDLPNRAYLSDINGELANTFIQIKGEMLEYDRTCNIGGKSAKRGKVQEYIFTNIPGVTRKEAE